MGIGEAHAMLGQGIDVRCRDLRLRVVDLRVSVAHVVSEDDDDVGLVALAECGGKPKDWQRQSQEFHRIGVTSASFANGSVLCQACSSAA